MNIIYQSLLILIFSTLSFFAGRLSIIVPPTLSPPPIYIQNDPGAPRSPGRLNDMYCIQNTDYLDKILSTIP